MSKNIVTMDQIMDTVADTLASMDGADLADLYNQIVEDGNLKYDGDSFYTVTEE